MAVQIPSYAFQGLTVLPVQVEVTVASGMPHFAIIGMAGTSVQEAKERARSAIEHSGFKFPLNRKIVNLAPAELHKQGSHFDLPIALGLLMASGQVEVHKEVAVLGELALDGSVKPVRGVFAAVEFLKSQGIKRVILPKKNGAEAALVEGMTVFLVSNLRETVTALHEKVPNVKCESHVRMDESHYLDFADIAGQHAAKRALIVAAAGGHHVLLSGPPGSGKSLLAEAFPSILPPLSPTEWSEVLRIHSIVGQGETALSVRRPFRHVHPRASSYALLGGGMDLMPGEVSLAHRGVLFMDEFPEFDRSVLEALREPLERRVLKLRRGRRVSECPCEFQLIAAMNPCPCGYLGDKEKVCRCGAAQLQSYKRKLSGPLLDRLDIQLHVPRIPYDDFKLSDLERSAILRERVMEARERQVARYKDTGVLSNQGMTVALVRQEVLDLKTEELLRQVSQQYALSGRALHRIIKVSRSLADLEGALHIQQSHLWEALQYRLVS